MRLYKNIIIFSAISGSLLLSGCVGDNGSTMQGASNNSLANTKSLSGVSPLVLRANDHHIEKPSDEKKKEEYDRIKDRIVVDNDTSKPAKQAKKDTIHQLLEKVPAELTQKFNQLGGRFKLIGDDWQDSLQKEGIQISSETKIINKFGKPVRISDAIVYFDPSSQTPTIYVNSNINYENNADNRKELEYGLIRGLIKSNNVIFDEGFVDAVNSYTQVDGIEFYNYPELAVISQFSAEDIQLVENQEKIATLFASIMADALENKEYVKSWSVMADYLDKFEYHKLELVDDVNSDNNHLQEDEISTGYGSRDLNWGNDKNDCLARVKCSILQKFENPVSTNVVGYEWELRNGVTKLNPKEVSMDQVLAISEASANQSGSPMPYIKLVVEENGDNAFIEVVTAPLTKDVMNSQDFKSALDCIYQVLSVGGTKTLEGFTNTYNELLKKRNVSADYLLHSNDALKDIKIEMKKPAKDFFQQANLLLDISKIFSNTPENLNFFRKNVFNSTSQSTQSDYNIFKKAITSEMTSSPLVGLSNENRIILGNGIAATLHKQILFNFLVMLRSKINNEQLDGGTDINEEVSFFIRSAPEDLIYSVLDNKHIMALKGFYDEITRVKSAVGTDSDGEQLYFKLFTGLAKDAGIQLPIYTFKQGIVSDSQISSLPKNTIYKDKDGKYWQSNKASPIRLQLKKSLPIMPNSNPYQLTEEEVNGYFSGIKSSFNDTFYKYYRKIFEGAISKRVGNKPVKIYNYTKRVNSGNTKGYSFDKISDHAISSSWLNLYTMPRSWGHEPLLLTTDGSSMQINTVVEFRRGRVGIPNKNVWKFPQINTDFGHVEKFYNKYNKLAPSFKVEDLSIYNSLL